MGGEGRNLRRKGIARAEGWMEWKPGKERYGRRVSTEREADYVSWEQVELRSSGGSQEMESWERVEGGEDASGRSCLWGQKLSQIGLPIVVPVELEGI